MELLASRFAGPGTIRTAGAGGEAAERRAGRLDWCKEDLDTPSTQTGLRSVGSRDLVTFEQVVYELPRRARRVELAFGAFRT